MKKSEEQTLIDDGGIRLHCAELGKIKCTECGSTYHKAADWAANDNTCPECGTGSPRYICALCEGLLDAPPSGQHPCHSLDVYRRTKQIVFAQDMIAARSAREHREREERTRVERARVEQERVEREERALDERIRAELDRAELIARERREVARREQLERERLERESNEARRLDQLRRERAEQERAAALAEVTRQRRIARDRSVKRLKTTFFVLAVFAAIAYFIAKYPRFPQIPRITATASPQTPLSPLASASQPKSSLRPAPIPSSSRASSPNPAQTSAQQFETQQHSPGQFWALVKAVSNANLTGIESVMAVAETQSFDEIEPAARNAGRAYSFASTNISRDRKRARPLNEQALNALRAGSDPAEVYRIQLLAFEADPLDLEIAGNLAIYALRAGRIYDARDLAVYALSLPRNEDKTGRTADWATLAATYAVFGEHPKATNALFVTLGITTDIEKRCYSAVYSVKNTYGAALRQATEAMFERIRDQDLSMSPECALPISW